MCKAVVYAEPSLVFWDAPCPSCGSLLWFVWLDGQLLVFKPNDVAREEGLAKILSRFTELDVADLRNGPLTFDEFDPDSLDRVELVMELREMIE